MIAPGIESTNAMLSRIERHEQDHRPLPASRPNGHLFIVCRLGVHGG